RVPELVRQRVAPGPRPFKAALRQWMPVAGVAAALVLLLLGWRELVLPQRPVQTPTARAELGPDPLVGELMKHHRALAGDLTAQGRADTLAAMVDDLEHELASVRHTPQGHEVSKNLESLQRSLMGSLSGGSRPQHSIVARSSQNSPATAERI